VLSLNPSDIQVCDGPRSQVEQFTMAEDAVRERKIDARKLGCHFDVPDLAGLSGHYASSHAYRASRSNDSQVYVAQHITAVAKIKPMSPHLSAEMLQAIKELPTWDQGPKPEYEEFFVNYGTHVVMSLALGGTLRIVVHHLKDRKAYDPRRDVGVAAIAPVLNKIGIDAGVAASYSVDTGASEAKDDIDINIFRDGGGSVASELTATLENYLKRARGRSVQFGCPESVRVNWVKALATDPTFCPDHTSTEFRWLHTLSGLTASQKNNLRQASEYYLKMRHGSPDPVPLNPGELPRKSNFQRVREKFTKIFGGRRNRGAGN
jgi:hypothetical protein